MTRLISLRIPDDLATRIDQAAGNGGRTAWAITAFEAMLTQPEQPAHVQAVSGRIVRASSLLRHTDPQVAKRQARLNEAKARASKP